MKKKVVVLVADKNYKDHAKSLFVNIQIDGKWDGDYCLVTNMEKDEYKEFEDKGIYVKKIDTLNPYFVKFSVFNTYFKQWDKIMYLDCDILINSPITTITNLEDVDMYCDGEKISVRDMFTMWYNGGLSEMVNGKHFNTNLDQHTLFDLDNNFDVEKNCFNSAFMYFDSKLINSTTVDELESLRERFKKINFHVGLSEGTDQPILNLLFLDNWTQIPNKYVSYFGDQDSNTIISHYCRWSAPWVNTNPTIRNKYNDNLNKFVNSNFQ
jgi:lipopolysaccharide biosynthesis glycosyltransferase